MADIISSVQDIIEDMMLWSKASDASWVVQGLALCAHALAGSTTNTSATTALDTAKWDERDFIDAIHRNAGNPELTKNWCVIGSVLHAIDPG